MWHCIGAYNRILLNGKAKAGSQSFQRRLPRARQSNLDNMTTQGDQLAHVLGVFAGLF